MADFVVPESNDNFQAVNEYSTKPQKGVKAPKAAKGPSNRRGECRCGKKTTHPIIMSFYFIFKLAPLAYLIATALANLPVTADYMVCLLTLTFDFWFTKNVAGRILSLYRWHSYVVEGKTYYYFETSDSDEVAKFDRVMFWFGVWLSPVYWVIFFIVQFFTLKLWLLPVPIIGVIVSSVNVAGYVKCWKEKRRRIREAKRAERNGGGMPSLETITTAANVIKVVT